MIKIMGIDLIDSLAYIQIARTGHLEEAMRAQNAIKVKIIITILINLGFIAI